MTQKTTLIADSGSTKTTWALIKDGEQKLFKTQGISLYFLNGDEIKEVLSKELTPEISINPEDIEQIFFYGTGLTAAANVNLMKKVLQDVFPKSEIEVNHDLTGAARALCQYEKGIACILGTGSGACYYDGEKIVKISPGLGFILGDEGSGAYLGKMLVQRYLYKKLNHGLLDAFDQKYYLSKSEILQRVYKGTYPNRFLASFTRFLGDNRGQKDVEGILKEGISDFLVTHIKDYQEFDHLPIHFVGGVAGAFSDVLKQACQNHELTCGNILDEPIEGLIRYHLSE